MLSIKAQQALFYNTSRDAPSDSPQVINANQSCPVTTDHLENPYYNKQYAITIKNQKVDLNLTDISKKEKKIY